MPRETILLVEDDGAIRAFTAVSLERTGYRVLTAADGDEGLRVFQSHLGLIALLLTDFKLPKLNGRDLADRILELTPQLPVLVMTGDDPSVAGVHECIEKPVTAAELVRHVSALLDRSRGCPPKASTALAV